MISNWLIYFGVFLDRENQYRCVLDSGCEIKRGEVVGVEIGGVKATGVSTCEAQKSAARTRACRQRTAPGRALQPTRREVARQAVPRLAGVSITARPLTATAVIPTALAVGWRRVLKPHHEWWEGVSCGLVDKGASGCHEAGVGRTKHRRGRCVGADLEKGLEDNRDVCLVTVAFKQTKGQARRKELEDALRRKSRHWGLGCKNGRASVCQLGDAPLVNGRPSEHQKRNKPNKPLMDDDVF